MKPLSITLLVVVATRAQQSDSLLDAGRKLTSLLKLDQAADIAIFQKVGLDRVMPLLQAVVVRGRQPDATREDWTNLHRAIAGQIEISIENNQLFMAAIYAGFQDQFYAQLEHDYTSALAASQQGLALQERSGVTGTLYLAHANVARNLLRLGRNEAALAEFRLSRQMNPGVLDQMSAICWRDLIRAEISLGLLDDARRDENEMARIASQAPAVFKATALMARADIEVADGRYSASLDTVNEARALITDPLQATVFGIEVSNHLMTGVVDFMRKLPQEQARQLAAEIERKSSDLPINVAGLARASLAARV